MTLATKHRPLDFNSESLVGQEVPAKILTNLLKRYNDCNLDSSVMPSSVILVGSHGSGKTTTARILARHLNCAEGPLQVCGDCPACVAIANDSFRDLKEVDAASNRSVHDINELKQSLEYMQQGKYRVIILDEAHMLTNEAWASLLKLLEEGKPNHLFVLCTTDNHKIPETIYSRSMTFHIRTVDPKKAAPRLLQIAEHEGYSLTSENAEMLSFLSNGHMRDSIQLLETASLLTDETKEITIQNIYDAEGMASFDMAKQFVNFFYAEDYAGLCQFVSQCSENPASLLKSATKYIHSTIKEIVQVEANLYQQIAALNELQQAIQEFNLLNLELPFLCHYYNRYIKAIRKIDGGQNVG